MTNMIVSVEGNIGSGKSTLLTQLKEYIKQHPDYNTDDYVFLQEPVDVWNTIKNENDKTILECFYADQAKFAFSFQMMAYISRLAQVRQAMREFPNAIIITERSVYTDKNVFAKMLYNDNKIQKIEYAIYMKWFDEFAMDIKCNTVVYVKTTPTIAFDRVVKRSRKGEEIPIEYLKRCSQYHDDWISREYTNVIELDGNIDTTEYPNVANEWNKKIMAHIDADTCDAVTCEADTCDTCEAVTCEAPPYYDAQWFTGC